MKFTFEADLARKGLIDYNTAIQRTYLTSMRLELAKPYSVIVLGHNYGWCYGEGLLSYPQGDLIRILDVYNAAVTEDVIDVRSLLGEEAERWPQHTQGVQQLLSDGLQIQLIHYGRGILLIRMNNNSDPKYLVVINIRKGVPLQERLLMIRRCSSDCEAKTDGRYMIVLEEVEHGWDIELYDLEDEHLGMQRRHLPLYISNCKAGRQIYDGWFYLLTNDHHNAIGRWDYYYCYRFPLDHFRSVTSYRAAGTEPLPEQLQVVRVKRQQPRTRPNNDLEPRIPWSSLELCRDEYSGQLVIVEGWHHNGEEDDAANAHYTFQPLQFPEPNSAIDTATPDLEFFYGGPVQTLNPADLPQAEKDCECPRDRDDRLKARNYVPRASTFLDVYLGSDEAPDSGKGFEFRLAVGSYHRASSGESGTSQPHKNVYYPDDNNERQYVGVRRFPPNGAPKVLSDLLCPTRKLKWPTISSHDPRSILYSTKRLDRKLNDAYQLVLINFDPWIRFPGLETMVLHPLSTHLTSTEYEDELGRAQQDQLFLSDEEVEERRKKRAAKVLLMRESNKLDEIHEPKSPWFWTERAEYLDLRKGFQFS